MPLVAVLSLALAGTPAGGSSTATLSLAVEPAEVTLGSTFTIAGRLSEGGLPVPGATIHVAVEGAQLAPVQTAADGSFSVLAPAPDHNETVQAGTLSSSESGPRTVVVDPRVALNSASLGPGRDRLSARVAHTPGVRSEPVAAYWYVAARGSEVYHLATSTETKELPGAVTYASAIVDPPAKRFSYRLCFNPEWEERMGPPAAHGPCPRRGFRLPASGAHSSHSAAPPAHAAFEFGGEGSGTPLAPFPTEADIAAARTYLAGRAGRTSLAVVDSAGHLSGLNLREHFESASVVKVMFLTAYLQRLAARHRSLSASDRALLYPMIHESNNDDASAVLGVVGGAAVARVAREAGMRDYAPGVGWWAFTQTSAADQALFFTQLGKLIPAAYYGYARYLMSTIEPEQSWGVPTVARPSWRVYFKTGALPSEGLFNEVALLERGALSFTVAVFNDGDPSQAYGEETIAGVGARLLGGSR